jgi:hypothetical protein
VGSYKGSGGIAPSVVKLTAGFEFDAHRIGCHRAPLNMLMSLEGL